MPTLWIDLNGTRFKVEVAASGETKVDGVAIPVTFSWARPGILSLLHTQADGRIRSHTALLASEAGGERLILDGAPFPVAVFDPRNLRTSLASSSVTGARALKAPMPGRILRVLVEQGDQVEASQPCLVIEAMKMQNELKAPRAGRVERLAVAAGETVGAGHILLVIE